MNQSNKFMPTPADKPAGALAPYKEVEIQLEKSRKELELELKQEVVQLFKAGAKDITVEAITQGVYPNCQRHKEGDLFSIAKASDFSAKWMKLVK